ncbi:putative membrane protein [Clostridioides difficile CD212]|nr:putative membrane protein [Clostridioides difficile]EQF76596.1 putative membrane protein [Clostridioides difficile CD212]
MNTDILNGKFSRFKSNVKKDYSILKDEAKEKYNKSKENINDKLTPSIEEGVGGLSRQVIKGLLVVLSLFLIVPAFAFVCAIVSATIALVCSLIAFVILIPFVIKFIAMVPDVMMFCIFATIAFVGLEILAWQILLFAIKLGKQLLNNYIHWIKRKNIYIKANEKMEKRKKATLNDEDLNKDINENSYNNDYYNREEESIKETDEYNDDSINFEAIYKDLEDIENKKGEDKHE